MGLDMYLYATYSVPTYHSEGSTLEGRYEAYKNPAIKSKRLEKVRQACGLPPSLPVEYEDFNWFDIQFPIAKWRKENAIHNWFIQNCAPKNKKTGKAIDDCRRMFVSEAKIRELDDLLDLVLKTKGLEKDLTCRKLLPTASGFFFGSTDYDEWYWKGLEYTSERIKALIKYQDNQNAKDSKRNDGRGTMLDEIWYEASW